MQPPPPPYTTSYPRGDKCQAELPAVLLTHISIGNREILHIHEAVQPVPRWKAFFFCVFKCVPLPQFSGELCSSGDRGKGNVYKNSSEKNCACFSAGNIFNTLDLISNLFWMYTQKTPPICLNLLSNIYRVDMSSANCILQKECHYSWPLRPSCCLAYCELPCAYPWVKTHLQRYLSFVRQFTVICAHFSEHYPQLVSMGQCNVLFKLQTVTINGTVVD